MLNTSTEPPHNNQDTLIDPEEDGSSGKIPRRPLTYSELVELKIHTGYCHTNLSGVCGFLETLDISDKFKDPAERIDEAGRLCDEIQKFCREQLAKMDAKKAKKL